MTDRNKPLTQERARARERALRAAKVASLCVALGGMTLSGCAESRVSADASPICERMGAGYDCVCEDVEQDFSTDPDCCEEYGGYWESGMCAVATPGPFVPPSMTA